MKKFVTLGLITSLVMSSFFLEAQNRNELIAWEVQGDTLLAQGDFKGAAELFTKLISKTKFTTPGEYDLYYKRGVAFLQMNEFDAALSDANKFQKATKDDQGHVLQVYIYQGMGKLDEALSQIDSLRQKYPDNAELTQWKVQTLMGAERHEEAKGELEKMLSKNKDPKLLLSLAVTYYSLGERDQAFTVFEDLIKMDPTQPEPYLYASSLCLEDGLYEKSLMYADQGLRQDSAEPNLMFYKGIALHELGQSEEGCRYMARAFNKGVDDAADYLKEYCYNVE